MVPTFIGPLTLKKHPEEQKKMASSRSLLLLQLPASASAVVAPPMQRLPWATISILPSLVSSMLRVGSASEISLSKGSLTQNLSSAKYEGVYCIRFSGATEAAFDVF